MSVFDFEGYERQCNESPETKTNRRIYNEIYGYHFGSVPGMQRQGAILKTLYESVKTERARSFFDEI